MFTSPSKADWRRKAKAAREKLHAAAGAHAARAIGEADLPFLDAGGGKVVAGYRAIGSELDPEALLLGLRAEGHAIALPVVAGRGQPLTFRTWTPGDRLGEGWQSIGEPLDDAPAVDPDVLLVPLLMVDRAGYRLGYGAGYYDMTLAALRRRKTVVAVGIAFAGQLVDAVPREAHDEPLDWILTEEGPMPVTWARAAAQS